MMPLTMAKPGEENLIRKIGGKEELRRHIESLGFVPGSSVTVIAKMGENLIVKVKESRVAVSGEMALKIMV